MEDAKKKKKKKILLIIIIIAACAAAALFGYSRYQVKKASSIAPTVMTDQVTRKTLTSSIAATGTIKSKTVTNVTAGGMSETGLKVTGVNVEVGDVVCEGDVLCTFDVTNAKEQMSDIKEGQAKAEAQAAANRKNAQRAYEKAVAEKETQLSEAQAGIDAAKAGVDAAQADLDALPAKIAAAKQVVAEKEAVLRELETELEAEQENDPEGNTEEIEIQIKAAQEELDAATADLEALTDPENEKSLKAAVSEAATTYQQATKDYKTVEASADEAIVDAKDALDSADLNSDDGMDSGTKATIRSLQETIDGEALKSPVSGTITAVNVTVDGIYTGGTVVTIQDTESLYVESSIKEADIPDVKEGMEVLVKTDATGDEELKGKVTHVAPTAGSGTSLPDEAEDMYAGGGTSSGTGYLVEIDLLQKNERLRIDMTAKLSLIKEQKKNVLVVPYDAVFIDENGNKTLHVVPGAEGEDTLSAGPESAGTDGLEDYQEVPVETGMESGYYVEILPAEGIENGTVILLPPADENSLDEMDPAGGL